MFYVIIIIIIIIYVQSTVKGHIRVKQNAFLPQVQILIHYLIVEDWRNVWKMKLNELGRQKIVR